MESSRKGSESTITLKKLIIFVLLFFLGILTVIFIYRKMHEEEESDESGKTNKKGSGKSGGSSGKGSVFLEMDEKEVEEILNKAVTILNSGKEVKEKIVDFLNEYISGKKKVSESMKKFLAAIVSLINKTDFKNLEDIRVVLEVLLDVTKIKY